MISFLYAIKERRMGRELKKVIREAWSWISSFAVALALAIVVSVFVVQPYKVEGHSMDPTLADQERIIVSKLPHTFSREPDYGDIVIIDSRVDRERTFKDDFLENPLLQFLAADEEGHALYVKRVIGKPGDELEIKQNKLYRNGKELDESYIKEAMYVGVNEKWVVPEGCVFVMGDNRNNSRDSRQIGYVPLDHVLGKKVLEISWTK